MFNHQARWDRELPSDHDDLGTAIRATCEIEKGVIRPVSFLWHNRSFTVQRINFRWKDEKSALALKLTPDERSAIGARAHARVSALFELAQMQAKTLQVYDELLGTDLAQRFADPPAMQAAIGLENGV